MNGHVLNSAAINVNRDNRRHTRTFYGIVYFSLLCPFWSGNTLPGSTSIFLRILPSQILKKMTPLHIHIGDFLSWISHYIQHGSPMQNVIKSQCLTLSTIIVHHRNGYALFSTVIILDIHLGYLIELRS